VHLSCCSRVAIVTFVLQETLQRDESTPGSSPALTTFGGVTHLREENKRPRLASPEPFVATPDAEPFVSTPLAATSCDCAHDAGYDEGAHGRLATVVLTAHRSVDKIHNTRADATDGPIRQDAFPTESNALRMSTPSTVAVQALPTETVSNCLPGCADTHLHTWFFMPCLTQHNRRL